MPKISVIMPSCNSAAYIEASVQSVLDQSHKNLELIVVDDASSDTTVAVLSIFASRDSRVKIIERKDCSRGPATPRNEALKVARGEFLAFIDSDDLWHPKKLELQLEAMRDNGLNFLSSLHIPFNHRPPLEEDVKADQPSLLGLNHSKLIRKNSVITSSALMTRSLLGALEFNQAPEYIGVEDYLLWLQVHQKPEARGAILKARLVFYRLRRDSISSSKFSMAKKIFYLLSNYQYHGKPLGVKKYYYFLTYAIAAVKARLFTAR